MFFKTLIFIFSVSPDPPICFRATKVGSNFATLEWKPPSNNGGSKIIQYVLKKRTDLEEELQNLTTVSGSEYSYDVKDLRANMSYYFTIYAENKAGLSKPCDADYPVCPMRPQG